MYMIGVFHYRIKVRGKYLPKSLNIDEQSFVWVDIKEHNPYEVIEIHNESIVEIQLLILEVPSIGYDINHRYDSVEHYLHSNYDDNVNEDEELLKNKLYMEELTYRIPGPTDRQNTSGITYNGAIDNNSSFANTGRDKVKHFKSLKSTLKLTAATTASTINLSQVMSNASMVWSKVKATAATIQQETKILTDTIFQSSNEDENNNPTTNNEIVIDQLHTDLTTIFQEGKTNHIQLLFDLWDIQILPIKSMPYERVSMGWKAAGWQKEDPVTELKSTGLLAIQAMVYIGNHGDDNDEG